MFRRLFDDAAIFPPGNAAMPDAVAAHLGWRSSPDGEFVGPFVCSSARWPELVDSLTAANATGISVAVTVPGVMAVEQAVAAAAAEPRARLEAVEVPLAAEGDLDEAIEMLDAVLPDDVTALVELPWSEVEHAACKRLASSRHHLKIRTGGDSSDSFPSQEQLATMIMCAVEHRVPFKLTAGLHNAVRHRDPITGFEHHGFLNVIAATAAAIEGQDVPPLLAVQDARRLAELIRGLRPDTARRAREQFVSFGSCSIDEPLHDLENLGLLRRA